MPQFYKSSSAYDTLFYFLSLFCFPSRSPCLLSLFLLFVFQSRPCSVVQAGLKLSSVGMTGMCHCAQISGYIFYNHMLLKKRENSVWLLLIANPLLSIPNKCRARFKSFRLKLHWSLVCAGDHRTLGHRFQLCASSRVRVSAVVAAGDCPAQLFLCSLKKLQDVTNMTPGPC